MNGVTFQSHIDVILRQIRSNNYLAAGRIADIAVEAIQEKMLYGYSEPHGRPPHVEIVDTEALFDSIRADVKRVGQNAYEIQAGSPLKYAKYVHDGYTQPKGLHFQDKDGNWHTTTGRHINGRPFIKDGLEAARPKIEKELGTAWKTGFTGPANAARAK